MKNEFIAFVSIFFNTLFLNIYGQSITNEDDYSANFNKSIFTDRSFKNPSYIGLNENWYINSFLGVANGKSNLDFSFYKSLPSLKSTVGAKYNLNGHNQLLNLGYSYSMSRTKIRYNYGINLGYQRVRLSTYNFYYFNMSDDDYQYENSICYRIGTLIEFYNQKLGVTYLNEYYLLENLIFLDYSGLFNVNDRFSIEPELFTYFNSSNTNIVSIVNLGYKNKLYFGYLNNSLSTHAVRIIFSKSKKFDFGLIIGSENKINKLNLLGFKIQYFRN